MAAREWIESGSRMYVTRELEFNTCSGGMMTHDLREVTLACRLGLEKLVVRTFNDLEYPILEEPNLKGERAKDFSSGR